MRAVRRLDRLVMPVALVGILLVATVFRLNSLAQRGFLFWDEAKFALEALRLQQVWLYSVGAHADLVSGKSVGTAKPTHALLIALGFAVLGVHDYVPLFLNACASVASVALTYLIGRRLFDSWTALLGALLLAVSQYDSMYARSGLSESDATALFVGGLLLWLDNRPAQPANFGTRRPLRLFAAGVLLGLSFTCNYRLVIYLAAVVAIDVLFCWRASDVNAAGRRIGIWLVGIALFPMIWQVVGAIYQANGLILFRNELTGAPRTYVAEVLYQLHEGKQSVLHFDPVIYLHWWVLRQGLPASLLLLAGGIRCLLKPNRACIFAAGMVIVPYIVFMFAPFTVPRNLVPSLPFASLLAAWAILSILSLPRRVAIVLMPTLVLVTVIVSGKLCWELTAERSGFAVASSYVKSHAGGRSLTTTEIMVFYLRGAAGQCNAPGLPTTVPDLKADILAGYHYAVVDRHHHSPIDKLVSRVEPRVIRLSALGPVMLGESPISSENGDAPKAEARAEYVNIYRLDPSRLPPGPLGRVRHCYSDRVV